MKPLNVAVIGAGNISPVHIRSYLNNPETDLVALCDIDPETLSRRGKEYGVGRLFSDYNEMLREMPEIDAMSVCTWNSAHAGAAIAALEAGKHVLCEKPMALNAEEARTMQAAAEKNSRVLQIGFVRRFGRDAATARRFSEELGEIYYARAVCVRRNGNPGGWFGDKSRSGGGPLIDLGVHFIDLVRYLMGNVKPVSVYGATFRKLGDRRHIRTGRVYSAASVSKDDVCDVEDFATALIRFENGAVLDLQVGFTLNLCQDETKVELFGTKGGADLTNGFKLYTEQNGYLTNVSIAADTSFDWDIAFQREVDAFVDAIRGRAEVRASAEDGVEIMRILDAVYRSAETGHEVIL